MSGTIVVLEDSDERVRWLTSVLPTYTVIAHADVAAFVKAVSENLSTLKLVVFDHDLGKTRPPQGMYDTSNLMLHYDPEGKTGRDAAYEVEAFGVPALVWSQNNPGREAIGSILSKGRKATVIQLAAYKPDLSFAALIGRLLR